MDVSGAREPVAVIGVGCRFPGSHGPAEFWKSLVEGRDSVGPIPPDRWDVDTFYDPGAAPGRTNQRDGGYLGDIDDFDAAFFQISPREAVKIDPQQRILLETAWEAIEDAGLPLEKLRASRTGVFAGVHWNDFENLNVTDPYFQDLYLTRGTSRSVLAGRIAYALDLRGPTVAVDSACASSLAATHLACQSLWLGESEVALAAGVNVLLLPGYHIAFAQGSMLSPDGRCKAFDASANGFVRSEGAGVVVLKPLSKALADGDRVYAVIHGSASNNDGQTGGSGGTPAVDGQSDLLRQAYRDARIDPARVHYVEAHGTGTPVGDPIEIKAIASVLGADRPADRPLMVGSVKTNIGHTEGAAGIAGLIKAVLSLHHRTLPASLHCATPNPGIDWQGLGVRVQRDSNAWPADRDLLAGVSSFGISGANVHVILGGFDSAGHPESDTRLNGLLPLSARSADALRAVAARLADRIESAPPAELPGLLRTAALRRTHHDDRALVIGADAAELTTRLRALAAGEPDGDLPVGSAAPETPRPVFVFGGYGGQWTGMARDLLEDEPVFRAAIEECDTALRRWVPWSLLEVLTDRDAATLSMDIGQPTLWAVQVALTALWRSWGVEPAAVIGHSVGEVAAAYAAGVLTLDGAAQVVAERSRLMLTAGPGAMAVAGLPPEQAQALIAPYAGRVSLAGVNGPGTSVISGDVDAVEEVLAGLTTRDVFNRRVNVEIASHSPHMTGPSRTLHAALGELVVRPATVPFHSTVTGEVTERLDASYWQRNLREPVMFWPALQLLREAGFDTFVEISPHPTLLGAIKAVDGVSALPSMRRDEGVRVAHTSLGHLYTAGHPVRWDRLHPVPAPVADLPTYPWQHVTFARRSTAEIFAGRASGRRPAHPLLGARRDAALRSSATVWESRIDTRSVPDLKDHRVQGVPVFPATGYVELALAAAADLPGSTGAYEVAGLDLLRTLSLDSDDGHTVQVSLTPVGGELLFQVHSDQRAADATEAAWVLHAQGAVRPLPPVSAAPAGDPGAGHRERTADEHYRLVRRLGLDYGPRFRRLARLTIGDAKAADDPNAAGEVNAAGDAKAVGAANVAGEAWADLALPPGRDPYLLHPAVLDACLQVVLAALPDEAGGALHLPVRVDAVRRHGAIVEGSRVHARLRPAGVHPAADVTVHGPGGEVLVEIIGVRLKRVEVAGAGSGTPSAPRRHELVWRQIPAPVDPAVTTPRTFLIYGHAAADRLRAQGHRVVEVEPGAGLRRIGQDHYEIDPASRAETDRLLDEIGPVTDVLYAWGLSTDGTFAERVRLLGSGALTLITALGAAEHTPRLWLVTAGAQPARPADTVDPGQATLWGLGRTAALEYPELRCTLVDLDPGRDRTEPLLAELGAADEDQVAWRGGQRYAARLVEAPGADGGDRPALGQPGRLRSPYRLAMTQPGSFDRLKLLAAERRAPAPGTVEIEVAVTALNFKDVMHAMGLIPVPGDGPVPLGIECAGHVAAVGAGVTGLRPGDPVVAIGDSTSGCLASHVVLDARQVVPAPAGLDLAEAVTTPIAFLTAWYGLSEVGRMRAGDRVLIHAGTGGVGLAAIQLARAAGAEVYATAGSEAKRAYLRDVCGVGHVMDSRSTAFADEVRELTGGRGVDIVLNSLSGAAIEAGLGVLAPHGRFVELGKRDMLENTQLSMAFFERAVSFCAVDVQASMHHDPDGVQSMLAALMARIGSGELRPLPATVFDVLEADAALRHLAQAQHIGKVLVAKSPERAASRVRVRPGAAYLITGGLGALGLTAARLLAQEGAGTLVLIGRGAPRPEHEPALAQLRELGATVVTAQVDVSDDDQLGAHLERYGTDLPPLRGVLHAAGVLADRMIDDLTWDDVEKVMRPKLLAGWRLHRRTADLDLDLFLLFGSVAGVLGNPGQAGYAAANCGLDALAQLRRRTGLAAQSIDWGPWAEIGLAAGKDRDDRLADRGLAALTPEEGAEALAAELAGDAVQVMVGPFDATAWSEFIGRPPASSLLREIVQERAVARPPGATAFDRTDLLAAGAAERRDMLTAFVRRQVGRIARAEPDSIRPADRVTALGVDSLMAMELRQIFETEVGASMPTVRLLRGPTIAEVTEYLLEQLPVAASATAAAAPAPVTEPVAEAGDGLGDLLGELDLMSGSELEALFDELTAEERSES